MQLHNNIHLFQLILQLQTLNYTLTYVLGQPTPNSEGRDPQPPGLTPMGKSITQAFLNLRYRRAYIKAIMKIIKNSVMDLNITILV